MMKLGTETGSLINHVMSRGAAVEPQLGMAATILMWSDRHPGTVNENGRTVMAKGGTGVALGFRRKYHDFSF